MCSGITSASTASRAFAANLSISFDLGFQDPGIMLLSILFMMLIAIVNFRGVGESVKANVALTLVELTGLLIIIMIGLWALGTGQGDISRALTFEPAGDRGMFWSVIAATTLAFFAMVGFEDSVNMVEETKDPSKIFPRVLLTALLVAAVIYVLVSISAITLVPAAELGEGEAPLLKVVSAGAPGFPLGVFGVITMFAVANSALINMLMASRLVYGMSREGVLPPILGRVHRDRRSPYVAIVFTSLLAFGLITFVGTVPALGGTTALLLLGVFTVVNVAVLVLRKNKVGHAHFKTPTTLAVLGVFSCAFLVGPWTGRDPVQYAVAGVLLAIGTVLWGVTAMVMRSYATNSSRAELTRSRPSGPES